MNDDVTTDNILSLALFVGLDFSADEAESVRSHLDKQIKSFVVLDHVDTDGVAPDFGADGMAFKATRAER